MIVSEGKAGLTDGKDWGLDLDKELIMAPGSWRREVEPAPLQALGRGLTLWTPGFQPRPWRDLHDKLRC